MKVPLEAWDYASAIPRFPKMWLLEFCPVAEDPFWGICTNQYLSLNVGCSMQCKAMLSMWISRVDSWSRFSISTFPWRKVESWRWDKRQGWMIAHESHTRCGVEMVLSDFSFNESGCFLQWLASGLKWPTIASTNPVETTIYIYTHDCISYIVLVYLQLNLIHYKLQYQYLKPWAIYGPFTRHSGL